jgi:glycosyltransferase involved in cell wall biosynthesis
MNTGRVLLFAYHYPPAIAAGAQRALRFSRYLPEFGYSPHVIAARVPGAVDSPSVTYVSPADGLFGEFGNLVTKAIQVSVSARNHRVNWVSAAIKAAEDLIAREPFDVVISTFPPLCTHLAALWLKLRLGIKWVADFRDPLLLPHGAVSLRDRISEPVFQQLIIRRADALIGVTEVMVERWRHEFPNFAHKLNLIWNGFDPEELFPVPRPAAKPYRVLAHIGDCYGARHPGQLLQSLERLIDRALVDPNTIRVHLVGPLDEDSPLRQMPVFAQLQEGGCLTCTDTVPREDALQITADADYLLILDLHDLKFAYAAPSKLFDYIRAGRPILALTPRRSTVETLLEKSGIPFVCLYPDDPADEVDRKVLAFLEQPEGRFSASEWFRANFDGRRQVGSLAALLDGLRQDK